MRTCAACGQLAAPGGEPQQIGLFCERCRIQRIKAGFVELALPGEIAESGSFTPYINLRR